MSASFHALRYELHRLETAGIRRARGRGRDCSILVTLTHVRRPRSRSGLLVVALAARANARGRPGIRSGDGTRGLSCARSPARFGPTCPRLRGLHLLWRRAPEARPTPAHRATTVPRCRIGPRSSPPPQAHRRQGMAHLRRRAAAGRGHQPPRRAPTGRPPSPDSPVHEERETAARPRGSERH